MVNHLKYLWYVLRHKYYVFVECWKLGIPWLGLIHDISKFRPDEWMRHAEVFPKRQSLKDENGFPEPETINQLLGYTWLLHKNRNKHHWEWWLFPTNGGSCAVEMKEKYVCEMVADWRGAGLAQGTPDTIKWYETNKDKMILHDNTRKQVEQILCG